MEEAKEPVGKPLSRQEVLVLTGLRVLQTFPPAHSPIHSLESSEASPTNLIRSIYLGMGGAVR